MSPSWKVIADLLNFSLMRRENSVVFYLLLEEGHSKLFIYYNKKLTLWGEINLSTMYQSSLAINKKK